MAPYLPKRLPSGKYLYIRYPVSRCNSAVGCRDYLLWRFFLARKKTATSIAMAAIAGHTGKASSPADAARGSAVPEAVISSGTEVSESITVGPSVVTEAIAVGTSVVSGGTVV